MAAGQPSASCRAWPATSRASKPCAASSRPALDRGVEYLTLFAFSSENWRRPEEEVSLLMRLFVTALEREVVKMHANNIRLKVVGDLSRFDAKLQDTDRQCRAQDGEQHAPDGDHLRQLWRPLGHHAGSQQDDGRGAHRRPAGHAYTEEQLAPHLAMAYAPEPDLFIRTGGEAAHFQFPAVAAGVHRVVFHRDLLARLQ